MFDQARVLPDGWEIRTLESLAANITSGGTPTSGDPRYYTEADGLPFAKTEDLTRAQGKHLSDCELQITDAALKASAAKRYPVGSILVSMYGTIGLTKITARELAANQALSALLPPFECDPDFLYHHLEFIRPWWSRYSGQTTQANISGAIVRAATVAAPPRAEQSAIARILDTLDTQIEKTQALIAKLEQVKEGLLHDLLTRGVDENGELRPSAEEAPDLYKESALGLIPREWAAKTLTDVSLASTIGPFGSDLVANDYRTVGVPVVFVRDIKISGFEWNSRVYVTPEKAKALASHSVMAGDVVLTKMGLPPCVGTVYPNWMPSGVITADVIRLRINSAVAESRWVATAMNSHASSLQVQAITGGVTRPKVTLRDVRSLVIAVPPLPEQSQILAVYDRLVARGAAENRTLHSLRQAKSGLMDDLLTGRVRVTPLLDPQETPATV